MRNLNLVGQDTVDAVAHHHVFGARLDMYIAHSQAQGLENHCVHQTYGRRLLGAAQQLVQREVLFFLDHHLDGIERISRRDHRADFGKRCAFAAVYRVNLFFDGGDLGHQRLHVLSRHETQIVYQALIHRVGHCQHQAPALELERYHPLPFAKTARQQLRHCRVHLKLRQLHLIHHEILAQDAADLGFIHPTLVQQQFDQGLFARLTEPVQLLDLRIVEHAALVEHDCKLATVGYRKLAELGYFLALVRVLLLQGAIALQQIVLLEGEGRGYAQIVVIPRLEDEFVDRPFINRAHYRAGIRVASQHDTYHLGTDVLGALEQLGPIEAGHHVVGDEKVKFLLRQQREGLVTVGGSEDIVVLMLKDAPQRPQHVRFIIHQQQAITRMFRRGLRSGGVGKYRCVTRHKHTWTL